MYGFSIILIRVVIMRLHAVTTVIIRVIIRIIIIIIQIGITNGGVIQIIGKCGILSSGSN